MKRLPMEIILDVLQGGLETTSGLLDIFLSGYGESCRKARRFSLNGPRRSSRRWSGEYRKFNHFYSILSRLRKDGLIEREEKERKDRNSIWSITKKGRGKLLLLKEKQLFSHRTAQYLKEEDRKLKIVIFDIPERERCKRNWLNFALKNLGFEMLQKSVFIGENKIPKEFLEGLYEREMFNYVHIFEVTKTGTLVNKDKN